MFFAPRILSVREILESFVIRGRPRAQPPTWIACDKRRLILGTTRASPTWTGDRGHPASGYTNMSAMTITNFKKIQKLHMLSAADPQVTRPFRKNQFRKNCIWGQFFGPHQTDTSGQIWWSGLLGITATLGMTYNWVFRQLLPQKEMDFCNSAFLLPESASEIIDSFLLDFRPNFSDIQILVCNLSDPSSSQDQETDANDSKNYAEQFQNATVISLRSQETRRNSAYDCRTEINIENQRTEAGIPKAKVVAAHKRNYLKLTPESKLEHRREQNRRAQRRFREKQLIRINYRSFANTEQGLWADRLTIGCLHSFFS